MSQKSFSADAHSLVIDALNKWISDLTGAAKFNSVLLVGEKLLEYCAQVHAMQRKLEQARLPLTPTRAGSFQVRYLPIYRDGLQRIIALDKIRGVQTAEGVTKLFSEL